MAVHAADTPGGRTNFLTSPWHERRRATGAKGLPLVCTGKVVVMLITALALTSCAGAANVPAAYHTTTPLIPSRGIGIPATYVVPAKLPVDGIPLVVMAHGHGGSREESGAFTDVARQLALRGIASIRVDFAGCGESTEPFTNNNLRTMLEDLEAARQYALATGDIDPGRIGVLGYSMGGRVALLSLDAEPAYAAAVLWAPAAGDGPDAMFPFMGGRDVYLERREAAMANGSVEIRTRWGKSQQLGADWFIDLESRRPMEVLRHFAGALLVLHGANDDVIAPEFGAAVAEAAVNSRRVRFELMPATGHGFGFYAEEHAAADAVIAATVDFLVATLGQRTNSARNESRAVQCAPFAEARTACDGSPGISIRTNCCRTPALQ